MNTITATLSAAVAGAQTADQAVAAIKSYRFGDSVAPLNGIESAVRGSLGNPDARKAMAGALTALLASDATKDAKLFACRQLALCGLPENVPGIAPLLRNIETSNMARIAIERIPGAEADEALLDALKKADDASKVGIVNSLGARRAASAVPALAKLVRAKDPVLAEAAAAALGHIGGPDALKVLKGRVAKSAQETAKNAVLECEERMRAGQVKTA